VRVVRGSDKNERPGFASYAILTAAFTRSHVEGLKGYEVYRFGGAELADDRRAAHLLNTFFDRLDQRRKS